jgi:hypothetical protein
MNVFKFWDGSGYFIIAIPYRDRWNRDLWLVIAEGWNDAIIEYMYVPFLKKRIQFTTKGVRVIYSSKRRFIRERSIKYIPSYFTMGSTI